MPDQSTIHFTYIYLLLDPFDMKPRYVGQTRNPTRRLYHHLRDKRDTPKRHWLDGLAIWGVDPIIEVIAVIDPGDADEEERFWIAGLLERGYHLTNATSGGDGHFTLSASARAKIAKANAGLVRTPEFRARVSEVSLERWKDPVARAEMIARSAAARTGLRRGPRPEEERAKISATMKGVPKSAETRERMRIARLNYEWTPDRREQAAENARKNLGGRVPWNKGKKGIIVSDKALQALAEGRKKRYAPKAPVQAEPLPSSSWRQRVLDL
jgi:hypothetical protein